MKASETSFQPIIEGTKQYVVPLFQRPYSWTKKEWNVLWEDLAWLCENEEPKSHFIGSIVTMPTASVPEGVTKFLLIDGQQRLTTIFILLTLLRDVAKKNDSSELAQEIEQTMLVNPFKKGNDYFKLLPTQVDRTAFNSLLQSEGEVAESRVSQCYQFFSRKIKQTGGPSLSALYRVITSKLSVVSIVLDHDDNPHLVFESLNAKGLPLTQADLIRNYFFMRVHTNEQEEIHAALWLPMQTDLGESLTEFIRHYLMRNGSIVKKSDVYFTLKDRVTQTDAVAALKELAASASYYNKLLNPEAEINAGIRSALSRLNRLEITITYPFLLNCYHDYAQGQISANDFLEILGTLENFIIRRFVCNLPTEGLNKVFPLLYGQAQLKSSKLPEGVRLVLQSRGYPKDTEFRARLIDSKLYGEGDRRNKTKLILETLEAAHEHKETVPFGKLTIEHIMPQTLTASWQEHLGGDWQTDHELYLNTLGNLTLTAYNSELSNSSFTEKKKHLLHSHLELNRYFHNLDIWDRAAIEARSRALAESALDVWSYFGEEQSDSTNGDDVTGKKPTEVTILGQTFAVDSWRDVLEHTLNTIAELEPDAFGVFANQYPRLISKDAGKLRSSRNINHGFYIETHLSAKDINRFCIQAIDSVNLSSEDWIVQTKSIK